MSIAVTSNASERGEPRRQREARKARRRLYPVSLLYSAYSLTVLVLALRTGQRALTAVFFATGAFLWTLLEYGVHRYVLHGRFPAGRGVVRDMLHKYFDHLHWEHHARPWDGNHVNGTIRDTLPFATLFVALSYLAPLYTLPVMMAGVLQSYIAEEWVHHSVHFYNIKNRYFQYIKRHHLYHHSPKGGDVGYGLTNGFWDIVFVTRIPARQRRLLYAHRR